MAVLPVASTPWMVRLRQGAALGCSLRQCLFRSKIYPYISSIRWTSEGSRDRVQRGSRRGWTNVEERREGANLALATGKGLQDRGEDELVDGLE